MFTLPRLWPIFALTGFISVLASGCYRGAKVVFDEAVTATDKCPTEPSRMPPQGIDRWHFSIRARDANGAILSGCYDESPDGKANFTFEPPGNATRIDYFAEGYANGVQIFAGALTDLSPKDRPEQMRLVMAATERSSCGSEMNRPRAFHSATRLPDGRVLLFGGLGAAQATADQTQDVSDDSLFLLNTAELYDPNTRTFSEVVVNDNSELPFIAFHTTFLTNVADDGSYELLAAGGITSMQTDKPVLAFAPTNPVTPSERPLIARFRKNAVDQFYPVTDARPVTLRFDAAENRLTVDTEKGGFLTAASSWSAVTPVPRNGLMEALVATGSVGYKEQLTPVPGKAGPVSVLPNGGKKDLTMTAEGATITLEDNKNALLIGPNETLLVTGLPDAVNTTSLTSTVNAHLHQTFRRSNGSFLIVGGFDPISGADPVAQPIRVVKRGGNALSMPEVPAMTPITYKVGFQQATELSQVPGYAKDRYLVTGGIVDHTCKFCTQPDVLFIENDQVRVGSMLGLARAGHSSTLLVDGNVLLAGGIHAKPNGAGWRVEKSIEVYNPKPKTTEDVAFDPLAGIENPPRCTRLE